MSVFNFELLKVPFASGAILSEIEPFPDYVRGLGIAFEQTDGKPEMKGLNGLFNIITASMLSLRQRGISEWVTDFDYPVGAFSVESGKLYQAKTLSTSKQPSISQSDWTLWASVSDITIHSNGNIKKTNLPNGAFELKVDDANTTTKGAARFATATEVANKANIMAAVTPADVAAIAQSTDLGVGQTWQDVTSSRSSGVVYTNNTGRPISVSAFSSIFGDNAAIVRIYSGNLLIANCNSRYLANEKVAFVSAIIPNNTTYKIEWVGTQTILELR